MRAEGLGESKNQGVVASKGGSGLAGGIFIWARVAPCDLPLPGPSSAMALDWHPPGIVADVSPACLFVVHSCPAILIFEVKSLQKELRPGSC